MTIAVDLGRKATKPTKKLFRFGVSVCTQNPTTMMRRIQNTSTYLKGIIQITINLGFFCACMQKNVHIANKDLRICANNTAFEHV